MTLPGKHEHNGFALAPEYAELMFWKSRKQKVEIGTSARGSEERREGYLNLQLSRFLPSSAIPDFPDCNHRIGNIDFLCEVSYYGISLHDKECL
jgi:hypothetical protein